MEFVDSHCHLQFEKLAVNQAAVLANAKTAGVNKLICVGTSLEDSESAIDLANRFDEVWATVGVHPHEAANFLASPLPKSKIENLYQRPKVVAVGEIGLDFYKNYSPKDEQEKLLRWQLEQSAGSGLPYVFHVRDAWTDFWRIFDNYKGLRGVVHSFSSTPKHLDEALSRDLYVALNGIMTITSDDQQLAAAKQIPKNKLLLETDAPFLTPAAQRGKTCEPAFVRDTAEFLAELRGENIHEIADYTTANAQTLFGL